MASAKSRLADMYHSAEHFLEDMPIAKAIGGVISNPTPQEFGAQIANLGSSASDTLQEATKDPINAVLNFAPMGIITPIAKEGKIFYRHSHNQGGSNDVPWQMFADKEDNIMGYGKHRFTATNTKGNIISAQDLIPDIKKFIDTRPDIIDDLQATSEQISKEANPKNIVDTAELWDNQDLVQEIYDNVLEPKGIDAVETNDGLIVFNPKLIKKERDMIDKEDFLEIKAEDYLDQ